MNIVAKISSKRNQIVPGHLHLFRRIALAVMGILLLTSPLLVLPAHAQNQTSEAANLQMVLSLYSGPFNTGDFATFNQVTTADFVRHSPEGNFSREAYAASTVALRASFANLALTPLVVFVDGDWVAVNSTYSGIFAKDFPVANSKAIPATQKLVAFNVMVFYHFNVNGLLTEMWEEYDRLNLYMQLGAIPAPKGATIPSVVVPPKTLDPRSMVQPGTAAMRGILRENLTLTVEEAFNQGFFDPSGIIASNDFIVHPSEQDKDQFLQSILNLRAAMPDLQATVDPVIVEGNWAAVRVTLTGTFTKALTWTDGSVIPPTNKTVSFSQNDILRFDQNGYDAEQWTAQDNLGLLTQLGVILPPLATATP